MEDSSIILKQMKLGPMENFSYLLGCEKTRQVALVDPGWDIPKILEIAATHKLKIVAVLLTHGHPDHMAGLKEFLKKTPVPVYISKHEASFYMPECENLKLTEHYQKIRIGMVEIECLHTPGHTPGCQCFRCGDNLLTGDVLFIEGCGRCDLPGGNAKVMQKTLKEIILRLPDNLMVYPGHNYGDKPCATLEEIKESNSFLRDACEGGLGQFLEDA